MIGVSFSVVASAAVVTFSQFVATGETICVRGAPVWPSSAATGAVVFVPPALAFRPLQLVGEFFFIVAVRDELVVVSALMVLTRISMVSFFAVSAMARVSNDSPSVSAISSRTCCSVLLLANAAFAVRPALLVVSLLSSLMSLSAARKFIFCWSLLAVCCGLLLPRKVFCVDEPCGSEVSLYLQYHFSFAYGDFAVGP